MENKRRLGELWITNDWLNLKLQRRSQADPSMNLKPDFDYQ
jgi:hypothetical protein